MKYCENLNIKDIIYINNNGLVCYEQWVDILGFEGIYKISDLGRVKRLKIIKPQYHPQGYLHISLYKLGKKYMKRRHRLVMHSFYGESDLVVDHINGIKWDNRLVNLRYCTNQENVRFDNRIKENKNCISKGVNKNKSNSFTSNITINKVSYNLGSYKTEKEASEQYQKALDKWANYQELPNYVNTNYYSLHKYITYHKVSKKWMVRHKGKHIGYFLTELDAKEALDKYLETI